MGCVRIVNKITLTCTCIIKLCVNCKLYQADMDYKQSHLSYNVCNCKQNHTHMDRQLYCVEKVY
jgi:hypothetical protein